MLDQPYYNGTACIEAMRTAYGDEAVYWFCRCNAFKYLYRAGKKTETLTDDFRKARWYMDYAENMRSVKHIDKVAVETGFTPTQVKVTGLDQYGDPITETYTLAVELNPGEAYASQDRGEDQNLGSGNRQKVSPTCGTCFWGDCKSVVCITCQDFSNYKIHPRTV